MNGVIQSLARDMPGCSTWAHGGHRGGHVCGQQVILSVTQNRGGDQGAIVPFWQDPNALRTSH